MSEEEEKAERDRYDHVAFRNEVRDLVREAMAIGREHPTIAVDDFIFTAGAVKRLIDERDDLQQQIRQQKPIPMILTCPACSARHIDKGEFATKSHRTHSCQSCGLTWRPAVVPTVGVQFLPGFKDEDGK